jgi:GMP synthase-like glutamine amidotransferase
MNERKRRKTKKKDSLIDTDNDNENENEYENDVDNNENDEEITINKEELKKNNSENAIGCISSGSDYRLTDQNDANAEHTNIEALNSLKCPILGMCYAMQSMAKNNGANLATLDKVFDDNVKLSEYDNQHPLFNGIDLTNTQVSFNFNDYVESCPQGFKTIAKLDDKIAGIANDEKKHYGLLFHPEDIEDTYPILDNFIKICKKGTSEEDLQSVDANKNDMKYLQTYESFRQKRIK